MSFLSLMYLQKRTQPPLNYLIFKDLGSVDIKQNVTAITPLLITNSIYRLFTALAILSNPSFSKERGQAIFILSKPSPPGPNM